METHTTSLRFECVSLNVKPNKLHCKRLYHMHVCQHIHVFHQTTEVGDESTQKKTGRMQRPIESKKTLFASAFSAFANSSFMKPPRLVMTRHKKKRGECRGQIEPKKRLFCRLHSPRFFCHPTTSKQTMRMDIAHLEATRLLKKRQHILNF
ncbi:hypothetical protein AVEN_33819-1 [Araneus ventricosus]|uniref:Uncharacterized protein n=1 Tax=Araneus ventricosus TaxID=182803 RepID=A0A4Y2NP71_ARAVE|nr:hypothetical protein AVEN_33819-1 [Araneus ventricosus]